MGEFKRQDLVYEKEDLLISGPGKYPEYNFTGWPVWRLMASRKAKPKMKPNRSTLKV